MFEFPFPRLLCIDVYVKLTSGLSLSALYCDYYCFLSAMKRSYDEEKEFITKENGHRFRIDPGFVPNMRVSPHLLRVFVVQILLFCRADTINTPIVEVLAPLYSLYYK